MKTQFKVGDIVAYRASFLRSIGDYSFAAASKRMEVTKVMDMGIGLTILEVKCKGNGAAIGLNASNAILASEIHKEPN